MAEGSKQELRKMVARSAELIVENYPEIAKKIKAKDSLQEIVSELEKVIHVHVTGKGVEVFIEAPKEGEI